MAYCGDMLVKVRNSKLSMMSHGFVCLHHEHDVGCSKVQTVRSRFYPPSARMVTAETAPTGYTREGVIAWLLTNGLESVNPRVASKILRERGPEAEKRPSGLTSLAIRTPEPARTAGRQQRKTTTRRHKGAD